MWAPPHSVRSNTESKWWYCKWLPAPSQWWQSFQQTHSDVKETVLLLWPPPPLFLSFSLRWHHITSPQLCIILLLLHMWQSNKADSLLLRLMSEQMMDSALHSLMPHSFLLDQYVNSLQISVSACWGWKTILIYESISEACGQTGSWGVCLSPFVSAHRWSDVSKEWATSRHLVK